MKILLVKLSSLGDVVHALPVVQDIHAALPAAQIDWVVEKSFSSLLARCPGLHRIIPCEIRRWRKSPLAAATRSEWRAFKAQLQQEGYDAVIDLQGLSKSALVARLARVTPGGKRYALANQTEGSGYEAPTRWVADVAIRIAPHTAAVQRCRELAAQALGYSVKSAPVFGLNRPLAQELRAQAAPEKIANGVAFVHGTSRADKEWPLAHWIELGRRLIAAGYQIALPHGSAKELATSQAIAQALNEGGSHEPAAGPPQGGLHPLGGQRSTRSDKRGGCAVIWPLLSLAALTDELAHCAGVIGVDSGVSHIAVALDLPHVQIYNFDTAWRTGPPQGMQGKQLSVFAQPTPSVEAVWQAWLACRSGLAGQMVTE